jgi:hypothetical protein
MFEKLPDSSGNIVGYKLSVKMSHSDYVGIEPEIDRAVEEFGKVDLLCQFGYNFKGWKARAFWDDMKMAVTKRDAFDKVAVVGFTDGQRRLVKVFKPLVKADVKYYDRSHLQDAWQWLKEPVAA